MRSAPIIGSAPKIDNPWKLSGTLGMIEPVASAVLRQNVHQVSRRSPGSRPVIRAIARSCLGFIIRPFQFGSMGPLHRPQECGQLFEYRIAPFELVMTTDAASLAAPTP